MKQFAELVPVILFFLAYSLDGTTVSLLGWEYRFDGFYSATAVMMLATAVHLALTRLLSGHVERRLVWVAVTIFSLGSITLALHNPIFVQWKATLVDWAMALFLVVARWRTGKSVTGRLMEGQLELPDAAWARLDRFMIATCLVFGTLNLAVAYGFSEQTWVSYKLYSMIAFMLFIAGGTAVVLAPYLSEPDENPPADGDTRP